MSSQSPTTGPVTLRSFLSESVIYGLGDAIDKAVGFLLLPLTTAILSTDDYGILGLFGTSSSILLLLFSMGAPASFFRFYTEFSEESKRRQVFRAALWITLVCSTIGCSLLVAFAQPLNELIFKVDGRQFVLMLGLTTFFTLLRTLGTCRLQADARPWTYLLIMLAEMTASRGLGLFLILTGFGAWGWIIGDATGNFVTLLLLIGPAFYGLRLRAETPTVKLLLPYGASLVPAMMSQWVMSGADKFLLGELLPDSLHQIGLYTVGERISSIMQLINMAFLLGWRRFAFQNVHLPEGPRLLASGTTLFVVAGGYGALGLALLGDDLTHWIIASKFEAGIAVIAPLTAATLCWGLSDILGIGLHKMQRTGLLSGVNVLAAILDIGLNFVFIPRYGILGAAYTTFFSQAIKTVLVWWMSQSVFPIPFEYRRMFIALGLFVATFALGQTFVPFGWTVSTLGQLVLVALAPALLLIGGFFRPEEIRFLRETVTRVTALFSRDR